jgi:TPP-dependent pyruvate/acetoin dehydrogenase alpha subunit
MKKINKDFLKDFEKKVKVAYDSGKIKAPIHLSGNNEKQLINIFKKIKKDDWVFSTWRSHYHALLHGVDQKWLYNEILSGRSMGIINKKRNFFCSAIVGGILPIALGVALSIKRQNQKKKVWVFIGDMTYQTGVFHETYKYSKNFKLPIRFVIEDNGLSTNTPTAKAWGARFKILKTKNIMHYSYKRNFPHHGTGSWILF